jgi:hypothetical protein
VKYPPTTQMKLCYVCRITNYTITHRFLSIKSAFFLVIPIDIFEEEFGSTIKNVFHKVLEFEYPKPVNRYTTFATSRLGEKLSQTFYFYISRKTQSRYKSGRKAFFATWRLGEKLSQTFFFSISRKDAIPI